VLGERFSIWCLRDDFVGGRFLPEILGLDRKPAPLEDEISGCVKVVRRASHEQESGRAPLAIRIEVGRKRTAKREARLLPAIEIAFLIVVDGTEWPQLEATDDESTGLLSREDAATSTTKHSNAIRQWGA
jgi:hypothetical protein